MMLITGASKIEENICHLITDF